MHSRVKSRLNVALGIGAITLSLTSATLLVKRVYSKTQAAAAANSVQPTGFKHTLTPDEVRAREIALADPEVAARNARAMIALSRWGTLNATAEGRFVVVAAQVGLIDRRPNIRYHWSLFVHSESLDKRFVERHYNDQLFSVPVDDEVTPTFSEKIKMRPGTYQVELVLHAVPEGFDLSRLKDDETERSWRMLFRCVKVTIPN